MHLMITKSKTKKGIAKYAKIAHSYWDGKTSHQKILLNLGPIKSKSDLEKFKEILKSMKNGEDFIKENDVKLITTKEFGITYVTNKLLEKYGIEEILQSELSQNKTQFNVYSVIKALIINRLIKPSSDLSAYDWIKNDYLEELNIKEHQVYRSLDYLIKRKHHIEKMLFNTLKDKLKLNVDKLHYDLTSSYFEGNCCTIAMHGYSRDHRKDRKQIVIGLVICDGIPIYHEVHPGNTVDKTTLKDTVTNLKEKFGILKTILVADRGLITEKNLNNLEDENYKYILGMQRRSNTLSEKLLVKTIDSQEKQCAQEVHIEKFVKNKKKHIRRYVLCLDKNTKKERLNTIEIIKEKTEKKLKDLQEQYKKSQKSNRGKKMTQVSLIRHTDKMLGKNKRLFNVKFEEGLQFSLNKENYEYEKKIAGRFLLITNTDKEANEVMKSYKELQTVENAFDEIKNFLDIRPIGHYKSRRVRAHVLVDVLSFLVESIIERFSSESARKTIRQLERIKSVKISFAGRIKNQSMEIPEEIKNTFRILKIPNPTILDTKNTK